MLPSSTRELCLLLRQRVGTLPTLPILVHRCLTEVAKDTQLRSLAEAALEFGEAREFG